MWCRTARRWGVAAADAELPPRRRHALDRHLEACAACRQHQVGIERLLQAVGQLPFEASVSARVEQAVLTRARAQAREDMDDVRRRPWAYSRMIPVVASSVVGVVALVLVGGGALEPTPDVSRTSPNPQQRPDRRARSKPRIPAAPPAVLAADPDLFVDLSLLRNLDKLQHFDAIATIDQPTEDNG